MAFQNLAAHFELCQWVGATNAAKVYGSPQPPAFQQGDISGALKVIATKTSISPVKIRSRFNTNFEAEKGVLRILQGRYSFLAGYQERHPGAAGASPQSDSVDVALHVVPREEEPPKEGEPANTGPAEAKTIAERFFPKDMERRLLTGQALLWWLCYENPKAERTRRTKSSSPGMRRTWTSLRS